MNLSFDEIAFRNRHLDSNGYFDGSCDGRCAGYGSGVRRGFDVRNYEDSFSNIPEHLMNDYIETESDRKLILERIALRLKKE